VPVLACRDALAASGHEVEAITARSDKEIDAVIARLDGPERPDGLTWPAADQSVVLVAAVETDSQLRHVIRRMVRRYAPAPSKRPADVADNRTMPDLPAIGILPLAPATDLADRLGLPRDGADVAKAIIGGQIRRVDLFRNDGGSITLHGALLGGVDASGQAGPWQGEVIVDNTVLTDGTEPVLACAVANANGYAHIDEIALAPQADASSGQITVAVAVPLVRKSLLGRPRVRIEVRRASGRAVSVQSRGDLPFVDDGVAGVLTRKRSWWIEPGAWGVFTS
jgi:diacylglycerol kinase family enzyme